jgi:hypothetical protein
MQGGIVGLGVGAWHLEIGIRGGACPLASAKGLAGSACTLSFSKISNYVERMSRGSLLTDLDIMIHVSKSMGMSIVSRRII